MGNSNSKAAVLPALSRVPPFISPSARRRVVWSRRALLCRRAAPFRALRLCPVLQAGISRHRGEARAGPSRRRVFVEAGAHDGYTESNTYYLARFRGWSGVPVQAIPELYRQCVVLVEFFEQFRPAFARG